MGYRAPRRVPNRECILLTAVIALSLTFADLLFSQQTKDLLSTDMQILSEIQDHNQLMSDLEYLSDVIGPRLTGSEPQLAASMWAEQKFRENGLTNVHQENWVVKHSWQRGTARCRIIAPVTRELAIVSAGWSSGTNGIVQGPIMYLKAESRSELEQYAGKLDGAVVILEEPRTVDSIRPTPLPVLPSHSRSKNRQNLNRRKVPRPNLSTRSAPCF
jgi:carboxypeptidase Q